MIDRVDEFIFLDHIQFYKQAWQQSNKILGGQGPQWQTVPVSSKGQSEQIIHEVLIDKTQAFPQKHLRTIKLQYLNSKHFSDHFQI